MKFGTKVRLSIEKRSERVMSRDDNEDKLLDHNYDGIQEYDNDLPRWWLALFWGGIVFGICYVALFHAGPLRFDSEKLGERMAAIEELREEVKAKAEQQGQGDASVLLAMAQDSSALERGKKHFSEKCAACHMEDGRGLVGPNLTDDYWIHGGSISDIRRVVVEGVLEKGMVAWRGLMTEDEISEVSAFVWSLHGTNPENAKAPEGELVTRDAPADD